MCVACCCLLTCAALTVSVFRAYPQQRSSLFDEVLTSVVDSIHVSGKAPPRYFEAMGAGLEPLPVMMATSLIVQLVQVSTSILNTETLLALSSMAGSYPSCIVSQTECVVLRCARACCHCLRPPWCVQASVELPVMDAEAASIQTVFRAAFGWSDYLWQAVFGRLPAAKAARTEGAADFKLITQALLSGELKPLQAGADTLEAAGCYSCVCAAAVAAHRRLTACRASGSPICSAICVGLYRV